MFATWERFRDAGLDCARRPFDWRIKDAPLKMTRLKQ